MCPDVGSGMEVAPTVGYEPVGRGMDEVPTVGYAPDVLVNPVLPTVGYPATVPKLVGYAPPEDTVG